MRTDSARHTGRTNRRCRNQPRVMVNATAVYSPTLATNATDASEFGSSNRMRQSPRPPCPNRSRRSPSVSMASPRGESGRPPTPGEPRCRRQPLVEVEHLEPHLDAARVDELQLYRERPLDHADRGRAGEHITDLRSVHGEQCLDRSGKSRVRTGWFDDFVGPSQLVFLALLNDAEREVVGAPRRVVFNVMALTEIDTAAQANLERTRQLQRRAWALRARLQAGDNNADLVTGEATPRMVELLSSNMATLETAGAEFRAAEALALRAEGLTIEAIADLFGVTRQRISALLKQKAAAPN